MSCMYNFALLGQKPISTFCFQSLVETFDISNLKFVVTNLTPRGWWQNTDLYNLASHHNIPCIDIDLISNLELALLVEKHNIDFLFSVQYNKIISKEVISAVNKHSFNLHLAPLPNYRGWHSASHNILNLDPQFGSTLHLLNENVDEGPIYKMHLFLSKNESAGEIYYNSERSGAYLFQDLIMNIKRERILEFRNQTGDARRYKKEDLAKRIGDPKINIELKERATNFNYRLEINNSNYLEF